MFCTVLAAVVALGLVNRLGLPRWLEILAGLGLVGLAQKYFLIRLFRTYIISPDDVPAALLFLFLAGEAFLLAAAPLTAVWWGLRLCRVRMSAWVPLALAGVLAGVMLWQGFRQPPVREREVALPGLPAAAEGRFSSQAGLDAQWDPLRDICILMILAGCIFLSGAAIHFYRKYKEKKFHKKERG